MKISGLKVVIKLKVFFLSIPLPLFVHIAHNWKMPTSQPSSLEHDDDSTNPNKTSNQADNDQKNSTTTGPNESNLTKRGSQSHNAEEHRGSAGSTAITQHRNSGSRDSNGGKAVDLYIRGPDGGGGGGGGGSGSDSVEDAGEETDVIGDLVGHFGKWQFLMTILLSLFQVPNTFHISSSIYQVRPLTDIYIILSPFSKVCLSCLF